MKNIMKRAHEIKNEAAIKFNCDPSEIVFSICLEMAWDENNMEKHNYVTPKGTKVSVSIDKDSVFRTSINGEPVYVAGLEDEMFDIVLNGRKAKLISDAKSRNMYIKNDTELKAKIKNAKEKNKTGVCSYCGTYCHGDCRAN